MEDFLKACADEQQQFEMFYQNPAVLDPREQTAMKNIAEMTDRRGFVRPGGPATFVQKMEEEVLAFDPDNAEDGNEQHPQSRSVASPSLDSWEHFQSRYHAGRRQRQLFSNRDPTIVQAMRKESDAEALDLQQAQKAK